MSEPKASEPRPLSAGNVIFRYGLAGPSVGALVMLAFTLAQPLPPGALNGLVQSGGVLLVAAFIYGVLLAVPTGAVMALLRPWLGAAAYVGVSSLVGAMAAGLSVPALAMLLGGPTDWSLAGTYALAGALAALVCGWLSRPGLTVSAPPA